MGHMVIRGACAAALVLTVVGAAAAQGRHARGIELFSGPNFTGDSRYFPQEEWNLADRGFNDRTMSVRVYGRGQAWQLCDNHGYGGRCVFINRDEPDLNRLGMAGRTSSFRPVDDGYGAPGYGQGGGYGGGYGGRPPRGSGLTLFDQEGFRGRQLSLRFESANFTRNQFNDSARSLVAEGRWLVCEDADFLGRCREIEGEVEDLRAIGLSGAISSARPIGYDGTGGYGYSPPHGGQTGGYYGAVDPPQAQGRSSAFFPRPRANGRPIYANRGGEQRAADEFCAAAGYRSARYHLTRGGEGALEDVFCVR